MKLSKEQFDILVYLDKCQSMKSNEEIAKKSGLSIETVKNSVMSLTEMGYVDESGITENGYVALEPYRAKRAIFIAAGFGSRLVPVTLNTPKPLVRVHGTRMIDTLLDAVVAAGIDEIYVVRGYLREQFDQLLYKYPQIKFVDNLIYNEANNISSALLVRHLFENAYVMEADLFLYNPEMIQKYQYTTNYLGVPVESTDDWCFETKDNIITKLCQGGTDCYHMYGISYWNEEDGKQLSEDIKKVFEMPGGKERYWDQVPLDHCLKNYKIEVRPCSFEDVIEVDSFSELQEIDPTYRV